MERYPQRVARRMGKKRIAKRSKVVPFVKYVNYDHLLPTRYTVAGEVKLDAVTDDALKEEEQREAMKKSVKQVFEEKYTHPQKSEKGNHVSFFFKKLRF